MGFHTAQQYIKKGIYLLKNEGLAFALHKSKIKLKEIRTYRKYITNILSVPDEEIQRNFNFDKYEDKGSLKFSIIVPLYNTNLKFLSALIKSVQAQIYSNWELCMADGSDKPNGIKNCIDSFQEKDSRIIYRKLNKNLGISGNTNAAIELATGEYLVMLDHDDLLHPTALFENMKTICETGAELVYSDEMTFEHKIKNVRWIHFKPDFAIDNLRANNYICHLMVYKKNLLDEVGFYDSRFDGSQDHDMVLRLCEATDQIQHISKVLYFWRAHRGSAASDVAYKPYVSQAGCGAVQEHLKRVGLEGNVEVSPAFPSIYRIQYRIKGEPCVSIIIPNRNHKDDLERCLKSIFSKSTYQNYEILIVENNSTEKEVFEYYMTLRRQKNVQILTWEREFNYSAINNYAASFAGGEYLLFLNNDTEVISENWIEEMLMYAQRKDVGAVGAKLYYGNDTIRHAGVVLGITGIVGHVHRNWSRKSPGYMGRAIYAQNFSAITGACLMISRENFKLADGFDERFAVAFNDIDLCLKLRDKDNLIVWTPYAELYHFESLLSGKDFLDGIQNRKRFESEILIFREKWEGRLAEEDPYYNENFSKTNGDFLLGAV